MNECEHLRLVQIVKSDKFAYRCETCKRVWEWLELEYIIRHGVSPAQQSVHLAAMEELKELESRPTPRALGDCPQCDICDTVMVEMNIGSYACPECGNRQ